MHCILYTEVCYDPPQGENEPPQPGMSYIEFDINKNTTDLLGLYRYIAAKVHRVNSADGLVELETPR